MKIKADMHIHTKEDPQDNWHIKHSAKDIIDEAKRKNIKIISITLHNKVLENKEIDNYAKKKGITLIKGVERTIQGKHILIYGLSDKESQKIKNFDDLRKLKRKKDILVIAPHPYYPNIIVKTCLKENVEKHEDIIDALEVQQLYTRMYNPNKKAIKIAKKLGKGIIANSDTHKIEYFGTHYTELNLQKKYTQKDIFKAIRENKTEIKTKPLTILQTIKYIKDNIKIKPKKKDLR